MTHGNENTQHSKYLGISEIFSKYSSSPPKYETQPYEPDFVQLMWPIKLERKSKAEMGSALGLYYPGLNYAVIDDLLYADKFSEVWVHEATHQDNGASEQNVRERTKYRIGETYFH